MIDTFCELTKPAINPNLSDYFTALTGITQDRVDQQAIPLLDLLASFHTFCQPADLVMANGHDDLIIAETLALQDVFAPPLVKPYRDVAGLLENTLDLAPDQITTSTLPEKVGLAPQAAFHTALDDAFALARTLGYLRSNGRL